MGGNCCSSDPDENVDVINKPLKIIGLEESNKNFGKRFNKGYFKPSPAVNECMAKYKLYDFSVSEDVPGTEQLSVRRAECDDFIYEGQMMGDQLKGKGHMLTKKGDLYVCPFSQNLPNGIGAVYMSDGSYFFGMIDRGNLKSGKMIYEDGTIYIGEFKNGLRHGQGNYQYKDGSRYEGKWDNNYEHGNGKLIKAVFYENGKIVEPNRTGEGNDAEK